MYRSQHTPRPVTLTRFNNGAPVETVEVQCTFIVTESGKTIVGEQRVEKRPDGSYVFGGRDYRKRFPTFR